jgi:hypothetical protein
MPHLWHLRHSLLTRENRAKHYTLKTIKHLYSYCTTGVVLALVVHWNKSKMNSASDEAQKGQSHEGPTR